MRLKMKSGRLRAPALVLVALGIGCASKGAAERPGVVEEDPEATPAPPRPVEVLSRVDGVELAGDLYLPAVSSPAAGLVLLGPTGPDDRNLRFGSLEPFRALAENLRARDIAVLTLDDRGVGESGGDWREADYETLAGDALSALEWMRELPLVNRSRVGLFGLSEGSAVALIAAARRPEWVAFAILGSPPGMPGESALRRQLDGGLAAAGVSGPAADSARAIFKEFVGLVRRASVDPGARSDLEALLAGPGAALIPPYRFIPPDPAGRAELFASPWYRAQLDWNPMEVAPAVASPVLVIGGGLDPILPPALHHPPLAEALTAVETRFAVLPGLNHLLLPARTGSLAEYRDLDDAVDSRVVALIVQWLDRRFGDRTLPPRLKPVEGALKSLTQRRPRGIEISLLRYAPALAPLRDTPVARGVMERFAAPAGPDGGSLSRLNRLAPRSP